MLRRRKVIEALVLFIVIGIWLLIEWMQPVKIGGVHEGYIVLVENFPWTDKGRIEWFQKNRALLKNKYGLPGANKYKGSWDSIYFVEWDGHYLEEDRHKEMYCFDDMKEEAKCVEKKNLLEVTKNYNNSISFYIGLYKYTLYPETGLIQKNRW